MVNENHTNNIIAKLNVNTLAIKCILTKLLYLGNI